jgi:hypothetical protein
MNGKNDSAKSFNAYLDTIQQKNFEAKRKLIELDKPLSSEAIKNLVQGKDVTQKKYWLLEIFKQHNEQMQALVGQDFSEGTMERYQTSFQHTQSFLKWKYDIPDIEISKLDYDFLSHYEFWLKSERKCNHNTTIKYLSNFRKIINQCLKKGWLPKDPFFGFTMSKKEVEPTALSETELQLLASKKISIERRASVRDIFLFSCYTGLAYADVQKLKRSGIYTSLDGEKWLTIRCQKTNVPSRVPLLPPPRKLLTAIMVSRTRSCPFYPIKK